MTIPNLGDLQANIDFSRTDEPGDASFSHDSQSQIVLPIRIYHRDLAKAVARILGYAKKGNNGMLNRFPPQRHPDEQFRHFVATRIASVHPLVVQHKTVGAGIEFDNDKASGLPKFEEAILNVVYSPQTYTVVEDGPNITTEFDRWVDYQIDPHAEFVSIDGAQLTFTAGPQNGSAFGAPVGKRLGKVSYAYTWRDVPCNAIEDDDHIPTKILAALGKVNNDTWQGRIADTLYFESVKLQVKIAAVSPGTMGLPAFRAARLYDVTYNLAYFDKTWNKFPANDGAWYAATFAGGATLYERTAFSDKLFYSL